MRVFFCAVVAFVVGAFVIGCADLDYVDDYSDSTFYDDEYAEEEIIDEEDEEYAQDAADEEVVQFASMSNKQDEAKPTKSAESSKTTPSSKDDEEVEYIDEVEVTDDKSSAKRANKEIAEKQSTPQQEPQSATTPALQPVPAPKETAKVEPKSPKNADVNAPKISRDSRPAVVVAGANKPNANNQKIRGKGTRGLNQSVAKLKAQCENNGNLQKCEDLGRIYAVRGNISSSIEYYERACDSGNGLILSCFFLSKIYENDGSADLAGHYSSLINQNTLRNAKVGKTELLLSTGRANVVKRNLRMSCAEGKDDSCKFLDYLYKIRGEKSEARTYFGTECWRGNALSCDILRTSY